MPGDANVLLALAGKVQEIFEARNDDATYLSFSVSSITIGQNKLAAVMANPQTAEELRTQAFAQERFSSVVNGIPSGAVWNPGVRNLGDVYTEVLSDGQRAEVATTDHQRAAHESARRVLYERQEDGTEVESQAWITYKKYRASYYVALAESRHRNERGLLEEAEHRWFTDGSRAAVES